MVIFPGRTRDLPLLQVTLKISGAIAPDPIRHHGVHRNKFIFSLLVNAVSVIIMRVRGGAVG